MRRSTPTSRSSSAAATRSSRRIYNTPATRQMFLRRLRTLMDAAAPTAGQRPPPTISTAIKTLRPAGSDRSGRRPRSGASGAPGATARPSPRPSTASGTSSSPDAGSISFAPCRSPTAARSRSPNPPTPCSRFGALEFRSASGNPARRMARGHECELPTRSTSPAGDSRARVRFIFQARHRHRPRAPPLSSPRTCGRSAPAPPAQKAGNEGSSSGPYEGDLSAWGETVTTPDDQAAGSCTPRPSPATPARPSVTSASPRSCTIRRPCRSNPTSMPPNSSSSNCVNIGPVALDLRGVRFTAGNRLRFQRRRPSRTSPPAPESCSCAIPPRSPCATAPDLPVAGQYTGSLDNGGERLRLEDGVRREDPRVHL